MRIVGFIKTSLLDWDGQVSAVVYLGGCNFRCPFCHNQEIVLDPEAMDEVPLEDVESYLRTNSEFLDGVVVTGGEPTIHPELPSLLRHLRAVGTKVKLDTNGTNPDMLKDILDTGLVDYVAMDIKAPLDEKYEDLAGAPVPVDRVKRSIELLRTSGVDHEFRTTVVPILLTAGDVERIAAYIGGARKYALQQFRPGNTLDANLGAVRPYPKSTILGMAETAKRYVRKVIIRGDV